LALAWLYQRSGSTPEADALLYGIKPVVVALIVQAIWGLGRVGFKDIGSLASAAAAVALYLLGVHPLFVLLCAGLVVMTLRAGPQLVERPSHLAAAVPWLSPAGGVHLASTVSGFSMVALFLSFLKMGAVVFGGGYVLIAYLHSDFVDRLHWLTEKQLADAVAVGQFTPGPIFTTATFVGYLVGSWTGAVVATIAIFLPSFVFVAAVYPLIPRIRHSRVGSAFLDGVNAATIGLMAAVTWQLGRLAIVDGLTAAVACFAAVLLLRLRMNSALLLVGGALVGLAHHFILG
jgi:chromate transporter